MAAFRIVYNFKKYSLLSELKNFHSFKPVLNRVLLHSESNDFISSEIVDEEKLHPDMPITMSNPYVKEPRECILCKHNIQVNYKNIRLLSQFVSPHTGKLYPHRTIGVCKKQYDRISSALTIARNACLMPFHYKELEYLKDPKLFDPLKTRF